MMTTRALGFGRWAGLALLTGGSLLAGCTGGLDDLLTYETEVEQSITVPGRGVGVDNPLAPDDVFPVDFGDVMSDQLQQSFETQDINKDLVSSFQVTAMRVEVQNPDEAGNGAIVNSLEFLERLAFSISSEGADPVLVAESGEGAFDEENIIEYGFPVTEAELVEVLKAGDSLTMDTELETEPSPNDRPLTNADLLFTVELTVVADPAGAAGGL